MTHVGASRARLARLQEASDQLHSRFLRAGAAGLGLIAAALVAGGLATKMTATIITGLAGLATCGVSYGLALRGKGIAARRFLIHGFVAVSFGTAVPAPGGFARLASYAVIGVLLITLAGFVLEQIDMLITSLATLGLIGVVASKHAGQEPMTGPIVITYALAAALVALQSLAVAIFVSSFRKNQLALRTYVGEVDRVMTHAEHISKGDLTARVDGDSDVSGTIRAMLEGLRGMVLQSRTAAAAISSSAQEISLMARQQEHGAVEQASAVAQIHATLARLLDGSTRATHSTEDVFRSVELTQRTTELVAQRAAALSAHTRRISALLEIIKNIADKSEILALNAALEGARAGEAGRGFSLVASEMQRLAESVMGSVRDVRALVEDIDGATAATLAATDESTRLSAKATGAAREISGTLQQQRASTEQVAAAVRDIQQVTAQVSAGSTQALSATRDLTRLAAELKQAIEKFQLD